MFVDTLGIFARDGVNDLTAALICRRTLTSRRGIAEKRQ